MSAEKLRSSQDYHNILRVESMMEKLNISGNQLLELSDYIISQPHSMVTREDITGSETYKELLGEKEDLEEKLERSKTEKSDLLKKLQDSLKPFEGVLNLAEILKESK